MTVTQWSRDRHAAVTRPLHITILGSAVTLCFGPVGDKKSCLIRDENNENRGEQRRTEENRGEQRRTILILHCVKLGRCVGVSG
jgi:hypothetical protein